MTNHTPSTFARLFAHVRLSATAAVLVTAFAQGATAAPLTLTYSFTQFDSTFAAFDTNLGTLLGIDISLDSGVSSINPLSTQGTNPGQCIASFIGGSYTVSAPGGSPTLLSLTGDGNVNFACALFEVALPKHASASLDASLFDVFSSAGVSPITLVQTRSPSPTDRDQTDVITTRTAFSLLRCERWTRRADVVYRTRDSRGAAQ